MGFYYIQKYINNDIEDITKISDEIKKYNKFYQNVCKAPIGTYSINQILETVEESLNFLEIYVSIIKKWADNYLEKNRGILWLYYGIEKGNDLVDYWKQSNTNIDLLKSTWPFLFNRDDITYKGFIIDLKGAQYEILRQRERQGTLNPNYISFHPDGCSFGCSCWMLDDIEQWHKEELKEEQDSKNIFFNKNLQKDFYPLVIKDLEHLKKQWEQWVPEKSICRKYKNDITLIMGQTPINLVLSWIKDDFNYSLFSIFDWSDTYKNVWSNIDSVHDFIKLQRKKLKKIVTLL